MEQALIRSLMNKDFYDDHRGIRCPDKLFTKDMRKIKNSVDYAMQQYDRTVTPDEVEVLFMANNPTLTTAQKQAYGDLFTRIKKESPLGNDVAQEVLSKLFQQVVGEEIANLGFDYVNGSQSSLEPLRNLLEQYGDDFIPTMNIECADISIETLLAKNAMEARWAFNIPILTRKIEGVNEGHLIEVGARPNTGKTSFHASMIAGDNGFARQGARCVVLCNEESVHRVGMRYLTASSNMNQYEIKDNPKVAHERYSAVKDNIKLYDSTGRDMAWVESIAKSFKPDVVILDMGDKFAKTAGFARQDEALKANAVHARMIAKQYNCAIFYMSQLSAEAEGKVVLNQAMMEGSRTGKAAEADLMLLLAKNPDVEGEEEQSPQRHINVVKNKLSGWHGKIVCELDYKTARYTA